MKVKSTVLPSDFRVRKREVGKAYILLRKNVVEVKEEEQKIYEYDETEVVIADRRNLADYIDVNFDALFALGESQTVEETPTTEERISQLEAEIAKLKG